jgi:hypothetical protein
VKKGLILLLSEGVVLGSRKVLGFLARVLRMRQPDFNRQRVILGKRLETQIGGRTVQYGIFKGMRLSHISTWSKTDLPSMLLGMYEKEVVQALVNLPRNRKVTFVNVGAGDGYFAVGVLFAKVFSRSVAFEMSVSSRGVISDTAELNNVGKNLTVLGLAQSDFLDTIERLDNFDYTHSVFLIDIEGDEVKLLDSGNLRRMAGATLVIETHSTFVSAVAQKNFEKLCQEFHNVSEIQTAERNPGELKELEYWSDDERWAICSEGRPQRGRWLILSPKTI